MSFAAASMPPGQASIVGESSQDESYEWPMADGLAQYLSIATPESLGSVGLRGSEPKEL